MATLAEQLAATNAQIAAQAGRFSISFYTIKDHLRDPNAPYFASANMISSGNAIPPVVPERKAQSDLALPGQDDPTP